MSQINVVSSANVIMWIEGWEGYSREYIMHISVEQVLIVREEDKWGASLTRCGLFERKYSIQAQVCVYMYV